MGVHVRIPVLLCLLLGARLAAGEPGEGTEAARLRERFERARRFFDAADYVQAQKLYAALAADPAFGPIPPPSPPTPPPEETDAKDAAAVEAQQAAYARAKEAYRQAQQRRLQRQRQREAVAFFLARCRFERADADDPEALKAVAAEFKRLADNVPRGVDPETYRKRNRPVPTNYDNPRYAGEARYWAGRTLLRLGMYKEAEATFRGIIGLGRNDEVAREASRALTVALREQARAIDRNLQREETDRRGGPEERAQRRRELQRNRDALRRQAGQELQRLLTNFPDYAGRNSDELDLIRLRIDLRQYAEAAARADTFLQGSPQQDGSRARAALLRGRCAYFQGDMEEAVRFFTQALDPEARPGAQTRRQARHWRAQAYIRLARTAGPAQRGALFARAQIDLNRVIETLPEDDPDRSAILYALAEIQIDREEYDAALVHLQPLLRQPAWRMRARYLAGVANRESGLFTEAARHLRAVTRFAAAGTGGKVVLQALRGLAALERERGDFAAAFLYCRDTAHHARQMRAYTQVADAELGAAQALIDLAEAEGDHRRTGEAMAQRSLLQSLLEVARGAGTDRLDALPPHGAEVAFRLEALHLWQADADAHVQSALRRLRLLRSRFRERVRRDELDLLEGRALLQRAESAHRAFRLDGGSAVKNVPAVLQRYEKAAGVLEAAVQHNPRGRFAAETYYRLGEIYRRQGAFLLALTKQLQSMRQGGADAYREDGLNGYERSLDPYARAIETARSTARRNEARLRFGAVQFVLENFDEAERVFRVVANDPRATRERRLEAVLRWGESLERLRRVNEAIERLLPYVSQDLRIALLCGTYQEGQTLFRDAYMTFLEGVRGARQRFTAATMPAAVRARRVEAQYRAHRLGLQQAERVAPAPRDPDAFREASAQALLALVKAAPDTVWAARALRTVGQDYLARPAPELPRMLAIATEVRARAADHPLVVQAAYLLVGRVRLASKDYAAADAAFAAAEALRLTSDEGRAQRAAAARGRGDTARQQGDIPTALHRYKAVFANFPDVEAEADEARVQAARLHAWRAKQALADGATVRGRREAEAEFDTALQILDGLHDRQRLVQERTALERQRRDLLP